MEAESSKRGGRLITAVGLLAVAGAAALACWNSFTRVDYSQAVFQPFAVTLADRVHLLGESQPGAAYVVETGDGLILIDAGLDADAGLIGKQLGDLELSINDVKMILLTHGHGDHSLGARRLNEVTDAKIYAGAGDVAALQSGGPREAFFSSFYMPGVAIHPTMVDVVLEGDEVVELGNAKIRCIATPGHTAGSFCYLLERGGETILFTGDTITSLTNELGTYGTYLSPKYGADAEDYLATLEKLLALPKPDLVLPGHPRMERAAQSPRLSEGEWKGLLRRGISDMEELVTRHQANGRDFLDGEAKELEPGLFYLGDFFDWAVYALIVDDHLYLFDAPGGAGLSEFVREQLTKLGRKLPANTTVLLTASDLAPTGGIADLVSELSCGVVTTAPVDQRLLNAAPEETQFIDVAEFAEQSPFPLQLAEAKGVGVSPVAYQVTWQDRDVLISGRIPVRITEESIQKLAADLSAEGADPQNYVLSLRSLLRLDPDIWLPARPVHGQNANLYNDDWRDVVQDNLGEFGF